MKTNLIRQMYSFCVICPSAYFAVWKYLSSVISWRYLDLVKMIWYLCKEPDMTVLLWNEKEIVKKLVCIQSRH